MYSLTIHFGPSMMVWAFLFKDKEKASEAYATAKTATIDNCACQLEDDFGQTATFNAGSIHGSCFEDLDLIETARIQRALAEERCKVKLMTAARSDPVIGPAARGQSPGVLTPMGGGFRG